jgi:hypothetical protein
MAVPPASFLSLPYSVRREIYILAGLSRLCPLAIAHKQSSSIRPQQQEEHPIPGVRALHRINCRYKRLLLGFWAGVYQSEPDCVCPEIPKQLLFVSKAVYSDTHDILYRENSFVVRAHTAKDLVVLKTLLGHSIRQMRYLMVRLNCWPCGRGHDPANFTQGRCLVCQTPISTSDSPLRLGSSETEDLAQSWAEVCSILESNIADFQLCLTLFCDVDDIETAKQILLPLEKIPRLKSCAIRLGRNRDDELRSLARTTSLKLTSANQLAEYSSSRISFMDLPREIRLRILEFTHLGKQGTFFKNYTKLAIEKKTLVQRTGPPNKILRKMCCNTCNFTKKDCCCPLRYAAYSPSCQCRVLPLELLLVSRQMDIDASEILYSTNTFIFRDSFDSTLSFLASLRPSTLKLFRRVNFVFNSDQTGYWNLQEEAWTELIGFIRNNFSLSTLIVTIDALCDGETAMWAYEDEDKDILNAMHEAYVGATRVVKEMLLGLRGYHLELVAHNELASTLEEEVMGPEWGVTKWRQN